MSGPKLEARVKQAYEDIVVLGWSFIAPMFAGASLGLLILEACMAAPPNRPLVFLARGPSALFATVLGVAARRRRGVQVIIGWPSFLIGFCNLPYAWMTVNLIAIGRGADVAAPTTIYFIQAFMLMFALPGRLWVLLLAAFFQVGAFIVATRAFVDLFWPTWLCGALTQGGGIFVYYGLDRILKAAARAEARAQIELMPPETGLAEGAPARQLRRCVVLSSDWRGYQAMTRDLPGAEVAALLARYFDLSATLLESHGAGLSLASDWIADELIVQAWADDEDGEARAARALLGFARALLAAQHLTFAARPIAVDVGLAAGEDLVGFFGPEGRRKLMVAGSTLVKARALQAQAKAERARVGEADRILCDERVTRLTDGVPDPIRATSSADRS